MIPYYVAVPVVLVIVGTIILSVAETKQEIVLACKITALMFLTMAIIGCVLLLFGKA